VRRSALLATGGLAAAVLLGSGLTAPAAARADDAPCVVTAGSLSWGVKESFRAYVSGIIANGGWTTSPEVSYQTPEFTWSSPSGTVDTATGTGDIRFPGSLTFTGHGGELDLTFANPTVHLDGAEGTLLVDVHSAASPTLGSSALDLTQAELAELSFGAVPAFAPGTQTVLSDVSAVVSTQGAPAFGGFYPAGEALDPLTLSLTLGDCAPASASPGGVQGAASESPISTQAAIDAGVIPPSGEDRGAWLPWAIGGAAALILAAAAVIAGVIRRVRRRGGQGL